MLGLGRTSYLADIHNMKKKKKKKRREEGVRRRGGVWISPFMLSSVLDFEGLRASNTLLRTKLSFKIIFLIFIFFLFTFGVLLVDFNTIYSVLLLVFLVTKSISVYYQLPWFEMKKRYYIFVKFTVISFTTVNTQSIVSPSDFICFKEKIITQENLDIKNTMGVAQYAKAQPVCWIKTVRQIKELCKWDFFLLKLFHVPKSKWP